jgi:hypothetical protein
MTIRESNHPVTSPKTDILAEWKQDFFDTDLVIITFSKRNNHVWWVNANGPNGYNQIHVTEITVHREGGYKFVSFKTWETTDSPPFFDMPKKYLKYFNNPAYENGHIKWLQTYKELSEKGPVKETPKVEQKKETESKEITVDDIKNFLNNNDVNEDEMVGLVQALVEKFDDSQSQEAINTIHQHSGIAFADEGVEPDQLLEVLKEFDIDQTSILANEINEAVNPQFVISRFLRHLNPFSLDELKKQLT